ncbi:MAG: type II secretion system protein GspD [Candidatus Omnitrophica bacterium]|nr:type II secretion system protein GspD [Candidatus Omnitrophota bacterium]
MRNLFFSCLMVLSLSLGLAMAEEKTGLDEPDTTAEETLPAAPKDKERISLDLKGVDLVELFRILSLKTGLTIVPTKGVSGRINVYLNNQTFEDALDIILISQDLAFERKGDILYIMSAQEYEQLYGRKYSERRKIKSLKLTYAEPTAVFDALSQLKSDVGKLVVDKATGVLILIDVPERLDLMEQAVRQLDQPPAMAIFDLKYAKPKDLKEKLSTEITEGTGDAIVDERSNKLVISDLPEKMRRIERVVKAFDTEPLQVLIDAAIVETTLNDQFQRGVEWEKIFGERLQNLSLVGKFPASSTLASFEQVKIGLSSQNTFRTLSNALQFLKTYGDTKVLSRPRIAAVNGQEAKILVGSREAYVSQTLSQATASTVTSESIQFIDVGVKLNVVPTISTDGFVVMKIKPEVSSVRETLSTSLGSKIPIVQTAEAETVVKVKDGSMVMIGGLMKDQRQDDKNMTPGLGHVPIVGPLLFSSRNAISKKTELIIFLTPRIMTGEAAVAGTEPEYLVPREVMPEDMRHAIVSHIISKKLEEIQIEPEESALEPALPTRPLAPATPAPSEAPLKLKAMKEL